MTTRRERELQDVTRYMPSNTQHVVLDGRDMWVFRKSTEAQVNFEIAIYYDSDERGYCAQLVSPEIEDAWKNPHIGHIFSDGVICLGGASMRTRATLRESYAKSCLWAEGMALMIQARLLGMPIQFPFSVNNGPEEANG